MTWSKSIGRLRPPYVQDIIKGVLQWTFAAQCDGKSYFYQFELAPSVRNFFPMRLAELRGKIAEFRMIKMPMGWCYAPYIAQETSNFITREIGYSWVDNFIVGGTSLEEFKSARTTLRERISRYDILVDDDSLIESQHPCMLGIEFDLVNKKYRLEPAWIEKKTERLQRAIQGDWTKMSYRDIFETLGALIWATYVANTPLWSHAEALGAFSTLAQKVQGRWDDQAEMPSYASSDLALWAATVLKNDWCYETKAEKQYQGYVFSDASTEAEAFVLLQGEFITQAAQCNRAEENHIFLAFTRGRTIPSLPFPLQKLVVNDAKGDAGANSSNIHGDTGITWTLRKGEYEG